MTRLTTTAALALLLMLALVAGCDRTADDPLTTGDVAVDDYAAMDLDKAYGGLTYTDEEEAFGDEDLMLLDTAEADGETDDPLCEDPEVNRWREMHRAHADSVPGERARVTALRIVWGQLDGEVAEILEQGDAVDWSGRLSVERGVVVVRRVLLFERPFDHLVHPRIDRRTVAWISHTGPHHDGLIIEIIEPPVDEESGEGEDPLEPNRLHITTPLYSAEFPVAELAELDLTETVDEAGNAIRLLGLTPGEPDACPRGFLAGIWVDLPEQDGGVFKGRWVDEWGMLHGHLRGRYGTDSAGERVFYGKYIGRRGRVQGLIEGTWTPGTETGRGAFEGQWVNRNGAVEGLLGGEYVQVPERPGGHFSGRWATLCADEALETLR